MAQQEKKPNRYKVSGKLFLSRKRITVKVYSEKYGFIGCALRNEIADLLQGKVPYAEICVYDTRTGEEL